MADALKQPTNSSSETEQATPDRGSVAGIIGPFLVGFVCEIPTAIPGDAIPNPVKFILAAAGFVPLAVGIVKGAARWF